MIAPHEEQAQRNHSQTLKRLAERMGLSACEAIAVLEDRRWTPMNNDEAVKKLAQMVAEYEANLKA
jgi:hypothetical protein